MQLSIGIKEYPIETELGKYVLKFNPTDSAFFKRLYDLFSKLSAEEEQTHSRLENAKENVFEELENVNQSMRKSIDELLGENCCETLFGNLNIYAFNDGLPLWANLLLYVIEQGDKGITEEQSKSNARIDKYVKKYHR